MKRLLILPFFIVPFSVSAQWTETNHLSFDPGDALYPLAVSVDTTHYHHNIWQVGKPDKTVFTSAFSAPNAIVTDTVHPYPASDTSVFTLKVPLTIPLAWPLMEVNMYYQLDIDSNAGAKLEISVDSGVHWVNVKDSLPAHYSWLSGIPANLVTSTTGWTNFGFSRCLGCPHTYDTVLFRFTFISDSIASGRDGWMIDDIHVTYFEEGISSVQNDDAVSVYPNPSRGNIYIHRAKPAAGGALISIFNMNGRKVYSAEKLSANEYLSLPLPNGNYILKYTATDENYVRQIIIDR